MSVEISETKNFKGESFTKSRTFYSGFYGFLFLELRTNWSFFAHAIQNDSYFLSSSSLPFLTFYSFTRSIACRSLTRPFALSLSPSLIRKNRIHSRHIEWMGALTPKRLWMKNALTYVYIFTILHWLFALNTGFGRAYGWTPPSLLSAKYIFRLKIYNHINTRK